MKVEISESWGEATITCWCGPEEVKVAHKELTRDPEGELLNEAEVLVALLNAASEAVGSIPKAEEAPEGGETKSERLEREEKNRKALADWQTERAETEIEEEEAMQKSAAEAQAQAAEAKAPPPEPEPQQEPQPA